MLTISTKRIALSAFAAAALCAVSPHVFAATLFDGTWVIDAPSVGFIPRSSDSVCPALRFSVEVTDGQVNGTLTRVPSRDGQLIVEAGTGNDSAAVIGSVQPDGTVTATWENYHANGKLSGDIGEITMQSACGPRTAQAVRVAK
jgi:hypothetical protein